MLNTPHLVVVVVVCVYKRKSLSLIYIFMNFSLTNRGGVGVFTDDKRKKLHKFSRMDYRWQAVFRLVAANVVLFIPAVVVFRVRILFVHIST